MSNVFSANKRRVWPICMVAVLLSVATGFALRLPGFNSILIRVRGGPTVADRVVEYGGRARARLVAYFERANVRYPPAHFALVAFKRERVLELYAWNEARPSFVRRFPILAASGELGPKLREGDRQVPEGFYRIDAIHPNSRFHLALRLDYPNEYDRDRAAVDRRSDLGGDIMIHGNAVSIGCLAVGDQAAEDLFILAADSGWRSAEVIISPVDFRQTDVPPSAPKAPAWVKSLYRDLHATVTKFPAGPEATP